MDEPRSNHQVVWRCTSHVVWCPKYWRQGFVHGVDARLKNMLRGVADERGVTIREMEAMPDQGQVLMDVDPRYGVHRVVKQMKGRSSRVRRDEFGWLRSRLPTRWTNRYCVATTGGAPMAIIKQYIENQKRSEAR